ncbi:IS110 family transposase [Alitiscatomonas aceti]|uniref:IS110 family transposase n=1 Tax=Alitiscatomonas aceti TaxID=2981724 RepID=UPI00130E6246
MNLKGTKKKNQVSNVNIFEQQELLKKIEVIRENLKASTWHELETKGKFDKNAKISFICDDVLILGCDVGSETHYLRAIDTRGRELSKSAFSFGNHADGFNKAKEWAVKIAAENNKSQIVLGLEPTSHYWFCLATWMISNGISVVQVNPYAVKQTKELEDNSQLKDDKKDPKLIANLVKDGNFGMPYLPEQLYADLRRLSMFRDQLNEDRIRSINRLHRELKSRSCLITYLEDGRCSFSNNLSENAIRPFTVGRKNWLFCDTPNGAQASAIVYSMVEMAKANGVNVYHYLTYLLEKMPSDRMSDEELELLAPWNENVKTEIQCRVNDTNQSDVNCQGTPATEKQSGNFLTMAEF